MILEKPIQENSSLLKKSDLGKVTCKTHAAKVADVKVFKKDHQYI